MTTEKYADELRTVALDYLKSKELTEEELQNLADSYFNAIKSYLYGRASLGYRDTSWDAFTSEHGGRGIWFFSWAQKGSVIDRVMNLLKAEGFRVRIQRASTTSNTYYELHISW